MLSIVSIFGCQYCDGIYRDVKRGISLGYPLSPLMGALYLKQLDDRMEETGLFYARFMDDWVVITPSISQLYEQGADEDRIGGGDT